MSLLYASRMMEFRRDGFEDGLTVGLTTGLERGAHQTKLETARKFLAEGLDSKMVARCTGLPLETVERLACGEE